MYLIQICIIKQILYILYDYTSEETTVAKWKQRYKSRVFIVLTGTARFCAEFLSCLLRLLNAVQFAKCVRETIKVSGERYKGCVPAISILFLRIPTSDASLGCMTIIPNEKHHTETSSFEVATSCPHQFVEHYYFPHSSPTRPPIHTLISREGQTWKLGLAD